MCVNKLTATLTLLCSDISRCRPALIYDTLYHSMDNTNSLTLRSKWQISRSVWSATKWDASNCPPTNTGWSPFRDRHDCRNMGKALPHANSFANAHPMKRQQEKTGDKKKSGLHLYWDCSKVFLGHCKKVGRRYPYFLANSVQFTWGG